MRHRGFTIVELVIVITIMAILLTLGVVNVRGSQANGRDSERKTDIESIAQHLETYYTSGTDSSNPSLCTGGTITHDGLYTVHTFTSGGTLTCNTGTIVASVLVVGGGGGGGQNTVAGGGGGAGGFRTGSLALSTTPYVVTVGSGGLVGSNGFSSTFPSITSDSGGRGGNSYAWNNIDAGQAGASGGGGASLYPGGSGSMSAGTGVAGEGYAGGNGINWVTGAYSAGGGGGAGGTGDAGSRLTAGNGGPGLSSSVSGTLMYYAGGGAGGYLYESGAAIAEGNGGIGGGGKLFAGGAANTGGGGGAGASGGSGVVIVRYATPTTSNTYPSTIQMSSLSNIQAALRDIDINSLKGPGSGAGSTDPMESFAVATNSDQTTAGVTPQPFTTNAHLQANYIYQPLHADGSLCNDNLECTKFNLFYKTEVDNTVYMVSSINQ